MEGIHPTTGVPARWSLDPDETLGLIFWTRMPENLLRSAANLACYRVKVHMTVTGWEEVEHGAPGLEEGAQWLRRAVETFGAENVTWRFSPVPLVPDVQERFGRILETAAGVGLKSVYLSFLQANDKVPETRDHWEQRELLRALGERAAQQGVQVRLCQEARKDDSGQVWRSAVCAPPEDWQRKPSSEGCGCVHMVDPFTVNEACVFRCAYCYTANSASYPHKRNTTKHTRLPVLNGG